MWHANNKLKNESKITMELDMKNGLYIFKKDGKSFGISIHSPMEVQEVKVFKQK